MASAGGDSSTARLLSNVRRSLGCQLLSCPLAGQRSTWGMKGSGVGAIQEGVGVRGEATSEVHNGT